MCRSLLSLVSEILAFKEIAVLSSALLLGKALTLQEISGILFY